MRLCGNSRGPEPSRVIGLGLKGGFFFVNSYCIHRHEFKGLGRKKKLRLSHVCLRQRKLLYIFRNRPHKSPLPQKFNNHKQRIIVLSARKTVQQ